MNISPAQKIQATTWIWSQIKMHGLPYVLIIGALIYVYLELQEVKKSNADCQNTVLEMYKKNNAEMVKVIERNTQALKQNCK